MLLRMITNQSTSSFTTDNTHCIETELNDILTLNSCMTLVSELIKFILYRKQQLPYTFDRLKFLINKRNSKGIQKTARDTSSSSIEQQFKLAEDGLTTLELLFEKTKNELADSSKGNITEVALLFGSTPFTPKQVYRIHLPEIFLNHSSVNHPERKQLFHLLQSVILSNNLTKMLTKPMNPTNMYVFIKKDLRSVKNPENNLNEWFIPKNRYQMPKSGQHFHIKFRHSNSQKINCKCKDFKVYSDTTNSSIIPELLEETRNVELDCNETNTSTETEWYQACAIFKGFTDVYINGVSVADLWLR